MEALVDSSSITQTYSLQIGSLSMNSTLTSLIILLEVVELKNRRFYGKLLVGSGYQRGSKNLFNEWLPRSCLVSQFISDPMIQ